MDVLESVVNFLVVYFAFRQHNSLALVVGLIVSTATFWKTVYVCSLVPCYSADVQLPFQTLLRSRYVFWFPVNVRVFFSESLQNTYYFTLTMTDIIRKQDTRTQYWLVYFLPNIWWILFPGYIMVFFASKLIVLLP